MCSTRPGTPKARSGVDYPLDWWSENGRADRHGLMRYENSLPERLVGRVIEAFSDPGDLVVDRLPGQRNKRGLCAPAGATVHRRRR